MENGGIAEEGTHDSLMEADNMYAHMFEVQSRYYKEEVEEKEIEKKIMKEGDWSYV